MPGRFRTAVPLAVVPLLLALPCAATARAQFPSYEAIGTTQNERAAGAAIDYHLMTTANCTCDFVTTMEATKLLTPLEGQRALQQLTGQNIAAVFGPTQSLSTVMNERLMWQLRPGGPEQPPTVIDYTDNAGGYSPYGPGGGAGALDPGTFDPNAVGTLDPGTSDPYGNPCGSGGVCGPGCGAGVRRSYLAPPPVVTWVQGFGGSVTTNRDAPILDGRLSGVLFGGQVPVTEHFSLGAAGGYGRANTNDGGTDVDLTAYRVTGYGRYADETFYAFGGGGYSFDNYDTTRSINFTNVNRTAFGSANGNESFGFGEAGLMLPVSPSLLVQPFFGVVGGSFSRGSYTEYGAQDLGLTFGSASAQAFATRIGGRIAGQNYARPWLLVRPELRAAWVHQYLNNDQSLAARFIGAPDAGFVLLASGSKRDGAALGTGVTLICHNACSLGFQYDAFVAPDALLQAFTGTAAITW